MRLSCFFFVFAFRPLTACTEVFVCPDKEFSFDAERERRNTY